MTTKLPKRHQGEFAEEIKAQLDSFGSRLKKLRRERGWTMKELAGKIYDWEPGDAAHFDSRPPHRLIARGTYDAEVLLVASPVPSPQPNGMMQPLATQNRAIPVASRMSFSLPSRPPETRQTTLKISDSNQ
jgi:hypothetical protein